MRNNLFLLVILITLFIKPVKAQPVENDTAAIKKRIDSYIKAVDSADPRLLSQAFYQGAMMFWTGDDGQVNYLTQKKWKNKLSGISNPEKATSRFIRIMDIIKDIAVVKIESGYPDRIYYDYVAMVRSKDGWRIVNKIFTKKDASGGEMLINNPNDRMQIQKLIETKLKSMNTNDPDLLASVYYPRAMSYFVDENEQVGVSIGEWVARFAFDKKNNTPIPASIRKIQSIDCMGSVGYAKFTHEFGSYIVTDCVLLLKNENKWRIINLLFTSQNK